MSDRASTELKWHEMLEEYRKHTLPQVKEHWDELTETEKEPLEKLRNFYCGLHSYVQVAEAAGAALLEVQQDKENAPERVIGPQIQNHGEPSTVRLIRTAAKAFARGADEKNGAFNTFKDYDLLKVKLKESGFSSIPIVPFRGNRFNIVFFNGGFVYFLHREMISYLEKQNQQKLNRLLKAVLEDLKNPMTLAGCKAFGLIDKILMGPLWRILENNEIHMSEMGEFMKEILERLEYACSNIVCFMNGCIECSTKSEWVLKKDSVYDSLVSPNEEIDSEVETVLQVVLPAVAVVLKDHYSDLINTEFSDKDKEETKSTIKHNKFAERVFAYTDFLLRTKPNIQHLSMEAYIMFGLNRTGEWLMKKTDEERKSLIHKAMEEREEMHKKYTERRIKIRQERAENLRKKIEDEERKRQNKKEQRDKILRDILYFGLYQNEKELDEAVESIKTKKEKIDALKAQIKFRKEYLNQNECAEPKLFVFSENKKPLTWEQLKSNCLKLINLAFTITPASGSERAKLYLKKKVIHTMLEKNDENDDKEEGTPREYSATVISYVPGYPAWANLKYDNDDAIYVENLQEAIKDGTIKVMPTATEEL